MRSLHRHLLELAAALERQPRWHRPLIWGAHLAVFLASGLGAFLLRFDLRLPPDELSHLWHGLTLWLAVKSLVFRSLDLDRGWGRFVSIGDLIRIAFANLCASALSVPLMLLWAPPGFPRSLYLLDSLICFLATSGLRVTVRIVAEAVAGAARSQPGKRVLIYGAGAAGVMLLRELRTNARLNYAVCGFLDDHRGKHGVRVQGLSVLGTGDDLRRIAARHAVDEVLIAIPSASGAQMTRILQLCHQAGTPCKTVPGLAELIETNGLVRQIREVAVEDLLGRSPVRLDESALRRTLQGRVVLVTGAAGSIGSELCRQAARFFPAAVVALDIAETALFHLDREMRRSFPLIPFRPELGSIQNPRRLAEVFSRHRPNIVYHAAAYKHVPMLESHLIEAVENNVFGTYSVALAAAGHGVEHFVLISSDKAVRPTSIMGATKRLAELLVLSLQNRPVLPPALHRPRTKFVAVRFGNVLGSNGSVIPIFKQQIAAGGPVTVTHPDMRRFFMTIPEACQLVLQASTMGRGGEIFVLDMGEPVRILDLARNLILLSGLQPDVDIKIDFTGIRPGEKLYEELSTASEDVLPTAHEKIKIFAGNGLSEQHLSAHLAALRQLCGACDLSRLLLAVKDVVPDYNPSTYVLRRVLPAPAATPPPEHRPPQERAAAAPAAP